MFSRDFGRPQTAKPKYIFEKWCKVGAWDAFRACLSSCPLVQVVQACSLMLCLGRVFPSFVRFFVPLLPLLSCNTCEICPISRFKGVFRGFYMFGVGLYCLRALRGLWGFCTRVELGGLEVYCVFASVFILLSSAFLLCLSSGALLLLFSACPVWLFCLFLCGCCCFLFPFGQNEKERICFALFLYLVLVSLF